MIIDPIVHRYARQVGGTSVAFERLNQSVVIAEGGIDKILKAVRCAIPSTDSTEEAVAILCRSAVHALAEYAFTEDPAGFVAKWAETWAPQGAQNDPTKLNANWPVNVTRLWVGK